MRRTSGLGDNFRQRILPSLLVFFWRCNRILKPAVELPREMDVRQVDVVTADRLLIYETAKRVDFSCLAVPVSADGKIEEFFTPYANRLRLDFDPC